MKTNWKTTVVGVFKILGALIFVGVKVAQKEVPTTEDWGIAGALASGGIGNILSADAKVAADTSTGAAN